MEPNLHTGQFLIVNRLAYMQIGGFRLGSVHRGDIVVFDYPGNPSDDYVKRVIGLPGETVEIDEAGRILVNGTPLEEPYLSNMVGVPYRHRAGTWSVPDGSYFVLGDNRNSSSDSRSWGMLEEQYIVGKAWISYWPPQNWGIIPHYTYATP
jgi:signal peptidase I